MNALGRHILVEFYKCDTEIMNNRELIEKEMNRSAELAGATIVSSNFHNFNPYGVSGVVVIAESHLTIHTWPEYGYAAIDLFTCGEDVNPWIAFDYLKEKFKCSSSSTIEMKRGQLTDIEGELRHKPVMSEVEAV